MGNKSDEVTGGWRKLHNEELHNTYSSPYIRRMRWAGHVASMGNVYKILVGKPAWESTQSPRHRWEANIKMDLKGIGWEGVD
jgi:hypothetical protein